MVAGANGQAARVAPCLVSTDPAPADAQLAEAKLILLGAITRWTQQGAGGVQQQVTGPFSDRHLPEPGDRVSAVAERDHPAPGHMQWRGRRPPIGSIDTAPGRYLTREHLPGCDFWYQNGNGASCSCGLW